MLLGLPIKLSSVICHGLKKTVLCDTLGWANSSMKWAIFACYRWFSGPLPNDWRSKGTKRPTQRN